jgi:ATP-dependent DNA helicase RecG
MEKTQDGFEIAEADLSFRGPGELSGTRQWGGGDFRIANPLRDKEMLSKARIWAGRLAGQTFEWHDKEKERFLKWVQRQQRYWSGYGRIG